MTNFAPYNHKYNIYAEFYAIFNINAAQHLFKDKMASITCSVIARLARTFRAPSFWRLTPVGIFVVAFSARAAREVWERLPEAKKLKIKASMKRQKKYFYGAGGLCLVGVGIYYFTHLEFVPLTKRYRFMMYSRDDVCQYLKQKIGTVGPDSDLNLKPLLGKKKILPANHPYYDLVIPLVRQIITHNSWCEKVTDIRWRISIVDSPKIANAESLSTGNIVIYSGMLCACHNIDEISLMLSHEIAHIILNHVAETVSHSGLVSMLRLVCIAAIWFSIPSVIVSFLTHILFSMTVTILSKNRYNHKLELEADQVGLLLASKACFNPERAINMWKHLPMLNESDTVKAFFQTHPCNETRFMTLQSLLPQAKKLYSSGWCKSRMKKEMINRIK